MKLLPLIILLSICLNSFGQRKPIKVGRLVQSDFDSTGTELISDTLYSSCYNALVVKTNEWPFEQIDLSAEGLEIIKGRTRYFYAKVIGHPEKVMLRAYANGKLIDSTLLTTLRDIRYIPVHICGDFLGFEGIPELGFPLCCVRVGDDYEISLHSRDSCIKFEVLAFVASLERHKRILFEEHFCGSDFSDSFGEKFGNVARLGDVFIIKSITVKDLENDNIYTKLNQYRITIQ